ncbi:hypothetical protein Nepgr_024246 [Nepenthes gracilis]|uniref:Uncharacterized protein n=1 Tax=Nepenthes gracilis TaxID=150966 RepID=A0AAD3T3M7_NEPGR|nr:hypothetical protein Nepgr_024246 [Nepenthes gracilis]
MPWGENGFHRWPFIKLRGKELEKKIDPYNVSSSNFTSQRDDTKYPPLISGKDTTVEVVSCISGSHGFTSTEENKLRAIAVVGNWIPLTWQRIQAIRCLTGPPIRPPLLAGAMKHLRSAQLTQWINRELITKETTELMTSSFELLCSEKTQQSPERGPKSDLRVLELSQIA